MTRPKDMTTDQLKAEAMALFQAIEVNDCFGMSDLRLREAIKEELFQRGVTCNTREVLTFEQVEP